LEGFKPLQVESSENLNKVHNWHTKGGPGRGGGTLLLGPVPVALKDQYFIVVKGCKYKTRLAVYRQLADHAVE